MTGALPRADSRLILREEVAHVAAGSQRAGRDAEQTSAESLTRLAPGLRGSFDEEARSKAGFRRAELDYLITLGRRV